MSTDKQTHDAKFYVVFRELKFPVYSSFTYMSADGESVGSDEAQRFHSKEAAELAAKKLGWKKRFGKRVQIKQVG